MGCAHTLSVNYVFFKSWISGLLGTSIKIGDMYFYINTFVTFQNKSLSTSVLQANATTLLGCEALETFCRLQNVTRHPITMWVSKIMAEFLIYG